MGRWMDGLLRLDVRNGMPSRAWIPGIRIDVMANNVNPYWPAVLRDGFYGCFVIPLRLG
jgi:hypothetical protein